MRKWMFVCAVVTVVGFYADSASAQEPVPAPARIITSSDQGSVVQQRFGLFRGRRNRGEMVSTVSQPVVVDAKPMPATPGTTTTPPVVQTQGTSTISPIQGQVVQSRQGLLARLRARR